MTLVPGRRQCSLRSIAVPTVYSSQHPTTPGIERHQELPPEYMAPGSQVVAAFSSPGPPPGKRGSMEAGRTERHVQGLCRVRRGDLGCPASAEGRLARTRRHKDAGCAAWPPAPSRALRERVRPRRVPRDAAVRPA
eukprot:scaffold107497_cov35-Tisochrysis_lutea.AAC.3